MEISVAAVSVAGKRENWLEIRAEKSDSDKPDIKLGLKKHRNPAIKSKFEFTKGEFGEDAARLWFGFEVSVEVDEDKGLKGKLLGKQVQKTTAGKLSIDFVSLFRGTKLEIENIRLIWEASMLAKTIPKKDLERLYAIATSTKLPENLTKGVDSQVLLLFELLRGSKISIG